MFSSLTKSNTRRIPTSHQNRKYKCDGRITLRPNMHTTYSCVDSLLDAAFTFLVRYAVSSGYTQNTQCHFQTFDNLTTSIPMC
jgi:hypothetical protein